MSQHPFSDDYVDPGTNPYAASGSPLSQHQIQGNPLVLPAAFIAALSSITLLLILLSMPNQLARMRWIDLSTDTGVAELTASVSTLIVWISCNIAEILGAVAMLRLTSYRTAMTGAIVSVIPVCAPCFVLGIPFGIWALVLLANPQVKALFGGNNTPKGPLDQSADKSAEPGPFHA